MLLVRFQVNSRLLGSVWVAQYIKRLTLAQVMISWLLGSSLASGSVLTAWSLEPASVSVSPSLSAPPLLALCLCLCLCLCLSPSKINKHHMEQNKTKTSSLLVVKFLGHQKLCVDFPLCQGVGAPNPYIVQGSTAYHSLITGLKSFILTGQRTVCSRPEDYTGCGHQGTRILGIIMECCPGPSF